MSFDYGAEISTGFRTTDIKVWPTTGTFTALIDADAIPYIVGFCSTDQELLAYQRGDSSVLTRKYEHAQFLIDQWVERAGADSAKLYVTKSDANFRIGIGRLRLYKGQRVSEKPPFFAEVKEWLVRVQGATVATGCEADDLISQEAWKRIRSLEADGAEVGSSAARNFSDHCIVSQDKDLMMIPHFHCNPDTGEMKWVTVLGELEPKYKDKEVNDYQHWPLFGGTPVRPEHCEKETAWDITLYSFKGKVQDTWSRGAKRGQGKTKRVLCGKKITQYVDKLKGNGLMFKYAQMLMGDTSDNYPGLEGCGKSTTYEILLGCSTEQELIDAVYGAYVAKYGEGEFYMTDYNGDSFLTSAYDLMREQGQLAHMQTYEGEIWEVPLKV